MAEWEPPNSLSPTRMGAFKKCPLAFRFEYIQKIGATRPQKHLIIGNVVHEILEELMTRPPVERNEFTLDGLIHIHLEAVKQTDEYLALEDTSDFDAKIRRCAARVFDLIDPAALSPVGIEIKLEGEVDGWVIRGIIDLLEIRDIGLVVRDYKTGRAPSERYQRQAMDGIFFYALLIEQVFDVLPAEIDLLYLESRDRIAVEPTIQNTRAVRQKIRAVGAAIERACEHDGFAPSPSKLCDYCDYKQWCPAFGGDPDRAAADNPVM